MGAGRSSSVPAATRTGGASVGDVEALEDAVGDEPVDGGADPRGPAPQAPVLDDACVGQRPARANRAERELAEPLRLGRARRVEDRRRQHPLGQVVEALEALAPGDDELAVVPQQVEHPLGRLPAPHLALAGRAVEVPRAEWPTLADLRRARARGGAGASCRPRRTSGARRPAWRGGRGASRLRAGGRLRAPSTRSGDRVPAGRRRCRAGSGRSVRRARSGGSARRPRSSRAARTRGGGRPPRPPSAVPRRARAA